MNDPSEQCNPDLEAEPWNPDDMANRPDALSVDASIKREWVGLTEQEVKDIFEMDLGVYESIEETMRQLKEKHT